MRILLIHQYHHNPDCPASCRHYDFAREWSKEHDVVLLSSTAWEDKRITHDFPWVPGSARLISLHGSYDNTMGTAGRAYAFLSFAARTLRTSEDIPRPDVVVGTSTPLSVAWVARRIAQRWNVPFVFEVRDLWPDFPIEMGAIPRPFHGPLRRMERALYRSADHVVALSPDIATHVCADGMDPSRVSTLLHGTDVTAASRAASGAIHPSSGAHQTGEPHFTVLYAGTFGRANDIPTILDAAERLASDPRIRFRFAGHGYHRASIQSAATRLPNVELAGPVPRHSIFDLFANASVSLVTFADVPSVSAGSPSKMFDSLATGCPVIVNTSGWMRRLVEADRVGWYVPPGDGSALADTIAALAAAPAERDAASARAVQLMRSGYDRRDLADRFEGILESLTGRTERARRHNLSEAA